MDWNTLDLKVAELGGVDDAYIVGISAGDLREIKRGWELADDRIESLDGMIHRLIGISKVNAEMGRHLASTIEASQLMNAELVTRLIFSSGSVPTNAMAGFEQAIEEEPGPIPGVGNTPSEGEAVLGLLLNRLWQDHSRWSEVTFGPSSARGPIGPLRHLAKEVQEAIDAGGRDISELADIFILLLDTARRAGFNHGELIGAALSKMEVNKVRTWPDWRTAPSDTPIEHTKGEGEAAAQELHRLSELRPNDKTAAFIDRETGANFYLFGTAYYAGDTKFPASSCRVLRRVEAFTTNRAVPSDNFPVWIVPEAIFTDRFVPVKLG